MKSINSPNKSRTFLKSPAYILLLLCFVLAACTADDSSPTSSPESGSSGTSSPETRPTPTEESQPEADEAILEAPFSLNLGQSKTVARTGLTIGFDMVERDGRCPSAVLCAESGPVVIFISAVEGDQAASQFEMNPDPSLARLAGMPPNVVSYGKYEIELTAVEPYPEQPEDLMNLPYAANFIVRETSVEGSVEATIDNPFVLNPEESAVIEAAGLTVTFESVESDNRCPSSVDCFVSGSVIINVSAVQDGQLLPTFSMSPDPGAGEQAGSAARIVSLSEYEIELTAVDPYPENPEDLENLPHKATFIVRSASSETDLEATIGNPFVLTVGQSAAVQEAGLVVTFDSVDSDLRCPTAVECETAGPVVIVVSVVQDGQPMTTFTMNPEPGLAGPDGTGSNIVSLSGYEIELTAVNPYPEQPEDIMNMAYEATFIIR